MSPIITSLSVDPLVVSTVTDNAAVVVNTDGVILLPGSAALHPTSRPLFIVYHKKGTDLYELVIKFGGVHYKVGRSSYGGWLKGWLYPANTTLRRNYSRK